MSEDIKAGVDLHGLYSLRLVLFNPLLINGDNDPILPLRIAVVIVILISPLPFSTFLHWLIVASLLRARIKAPVRPR